MKKATALAILVLLTAAACATISPVYQGVRAEIAQNWDEAIALYEKAALMNPKNPRTGRLWPR